MSIRTGGLVALMDRHPPMARFSDRRHAMRYLFLLWGDEAAELALPPDERHAIVAAHGAFVGAIAAEGRTVTGEPLGPAREGIVVGRRPSATDGPFLETKEQLGGFYLIDCADRADAIAVAGRIPTSPGLQVEIREIPA